MPLRPPSRARVIAVVGATMLLFSGTGLAHDSNDCTDLEGAFQSAVAPGPECASPVGFCTQGSLTGDIEGTYSFVMTSMTPVPGDEDLGHFTFTGESTIVTADGIMLGTDTGELWLSGSFAFTTSVAVYDGEQCYEGAHGSLVATGTIDAAAGTTTGTYVSEICHAQNCFRRSDAASNRR